jgi:hypothetical protein
MNKHAIVSTVFLIGLACPAGADTVSRRATITGTGAEPNGKCNIQVSVDAIAEVEVFSDIGNLKTVSGQPAYWHRFVCNAPLPHLPADFRLTNVNGRGIVRVLHDPRMNRGAAVIHINDHQGGRKTYAFDLAWRAPGRGDWAPAPSWPPSGRGPISGGAFGMQATVRACQDSVTNRLNHKGYPYVTFERTVPQKNPGRTDWISGTVSGKRDPEVRRFLFSCAADFSTGRILSADIQPTPAGSFSRGGIQ